MQSSAVFSPDREHRYRLVRIWDPAKPILAWVMLNGSTADEHRNDPAVCRCIGFAKALGYRGIWVCNLYGKTSTSPDALKLHPEPIGPGNDVELAELSRTHDLTVLAWGASAPAHRAGDVASTLWKAASNAAPHWPCWAGPKTDSPATPCMCAAPRCPNVSPRPMEDWDTTKSMTRTGAGYSALVAWARPARGRGKRAS